MLIILSSNLTTHEVKLIGLYESTSHAAFPALRSGMMIACLHCCGISAFRKDMLKMANSSVRALGPSSFRKAGGMSSAPGAHFRFILWRACFNYPIVKGGHVVSSGCLSKAFFTFLISLRSSLEKESELTWA